MSCGMISVTISVLGSRLLQTAVLCLLARVPLYRHFVSLGRIVSVTPGEAASPSY